MRSTGTLRKAFPLLVASSAALGACNLLTGIEDLELQGEGSGEPSGPSGQSGDAGSRPVGGDSGNSGAGGAGGSVNPVGGDAGAGGSTVMNPFADASGVTITQIAIYQGVKVQLMKDGQLGVPKAPVVAGREALVRLWVTTDGNYNGKPVTARFNINGADPVETTTTVPANPDDPDLNSTINLKIPGASIQPGMQYSVGLLQPSEDSKGPNPGARYPGEGFAPTDTQSAGKTLKIVLVPIAYGADGSNRLPDTSPAQLQGYKDLFYAMYPAPEIDLTVRDPVQYNQGISANGNGWEQLLGYIGQVRANDNAPYEAYYYGVFSPGQSFNEFCAGGCVAGLGNIGPVSDDYSRHAIGLGFGGGGQPSEITWETAVHEIGHTHGRYHSPCGGAAGADPQYPHDGALLGEWGYNLVTQQLYGPDNFTDVMGYCQPIWVSDYTFNAFFQRIKGVNNANKVFPQEVMDLTYDRARIDGKGDVHWDSSLHLKYPPQALEQVDLTVQTGKIAQVVKAQLYTYDHLPGGMLVWPQSGAPASSVTFQWEGATKTISR
jgi:hypothetical protein